MFSHIMSNIDRKSIIAIRKFLVHAFAYRKDFLQSDIWLFLQQNFKQDL